MEQSPLQKRRAQIPSGFCKHEYLYVFLIAFGISFLFFLPALIMGKGLFTFYGDYVVQQIPFYKHCHEMVRSGSFLWDWGTDLGANFIGSYSFYLLGSPFFWLTIPFPNAWVPYLMAPIFFIKFGVAATTSYLYFKRFTVRWETAFLGSLLYAFSAFQIYNIFFNHFHDVVALFPLLLVGLEMLITENKKGVFALAVCITALCNYFFFVGEVVFVLLYFIIRSLYCNGWKMSLKKFGFTALEAVLGVAMAALILLPSFFTVMSNPRVGGTLGGYHILLYSNVQRYAAIIQSFLFPPELPSRMNFFTDANTKWTSMAGWLPLFGMTGVFAYLTAKRRTWLKTILVSSFVMMFIPVLNSLFVALNGSFYCRWYFMPVLMCALATALSLEDPKIDLMRGLRISSFLTLILVLFIGFVPKNDSALDVDPSLQGTALFQAKLKALFTNGGLYEDAGRFWLYCLIALVSLAMVWLLIRHFKNHHAFYQITAGCTAFIILITGVSYLIYGRAISGNHDWIRNDLVNSRLELPEDPKDNFFRVDFPDSFDNVGIYWDYPSVTAFHSIVPRSIMDFYPVTGTKRSVGSRPELDRYGVRGLTSCKYYFQRGTSYDPDDPPMPGFSYRFTSNNVTVWENNHYIPMGFTYDKAISRASLESYPEAQRDKVMLHALCLSDADLAKYADYLDLMSHDELPEITEMTYFNDCTLRKETTCQNFTYSSSGFRAEITPKNKELVFFSVPFEEGWSATVNGKPAEIIVSNIGFMSVAVPGGQKSVIEFHYMTPGLIPGLVISGAAFLFWLVYFILTHRKKQEKTPCNALCASCKASYRTDRYTLPLLHPELPDPFTAAEKAAEAEEESEETKDTPPDAEHTPKDEAPAKIDPNRNAVDWLEDLYENPPEGLDSLLDDLNDKQ